MALKDSYLNLITSQHRGKPKFGATMAKLLQPSEDIFALGIFMDESFDLDLAAGKQQDILGDIVGLPRTMNFTMGPDRSSVLDDEEYRVLQKAKIVRNLWNGRIEDLYEKWMVLFGTPIKVKDNQNMTLDVLLDVDESSEMQKLMKLTARGLIVPKPMGVRLNCLFYYPDIIQPMEIRQRAEILQIVDAHHNPYNKGIAELVRYNRKHRLNESFYYSGIYPMDAAYRTRQVQHQDCTQSTNCVHIFKPIHRIVLNSRCNVNIAYKPSLYAVGSCIADSKQKIKMLPIVKATSVVDCEYTSNDEPRETNAYNRKFAYNGLHTYSKSKISTGLLDNLCTIIITKNGRKVGAERV